MTEKKEIEEIIPGIKNALVGLEKIVGFNEYETILEELA